MLTVTLTFDDPNLEQDFYDVIIKQNQQDFSQYLGGDIEDIRSATAQDVREFAIAFIGKQILDNYKNLKSHQVTLAMQRQLQEELRHIEAPSLRRKKPAKEDLIAAAVGKAKKK